MTALGPGEMQARKRPLVVLAVVAVRLLVGFCLAWPLASLVASSGVGLRPEGDRVLFESGGYLLLEVARLKGVGLAAAARGLLPLLALGLALTAVCNAALLVALNVRGRLGLGEWLGSSFARLPALLVLGVGTGLAQGLLLGVGVALSEVLPEPLARPVAASAGQLGLWLVLGAGAGVLGGLSDVAKASLVRHGSRLARALSQAWGCARRHPVRACFGWLPFGLVFALSGWFGSLLTAELDVSRPGAWRVVCVFLVHQVVVLLSVTLRAAWYARALRLTASVAA